VEIENKTKQKDSIMARFIICSRDFGGYLVYTVLASKSTHVSSIVSRIGEVFPCLAGEVTEFVRLGLRIRQGASRRKDNCDGREGARGGLEVSAILLGAG